MGVCYKINDTQTECCHPLYDTCSISGEGPMPTGPVGPDGKALRDLVDRIAQAFKNLIAGNKKEESAEQARARAAFLREQPFLGDGCLLGKNKILYCKPRP